MDLIEKEIKKIDHILKIYDEELESYDARAKVIIKKIKKHFEPFAENNGLLSKSSIKDIKYYSFVYRVKEPDSLKEKFIRNDLLHKYFNFVKDDFDTKQGLKPKIVEGLLKITDLIGIRILTDINNDCKRVYDLIKSKEFIESLKEEEIELNHTDLNKQPVPMENGLDIYKLKGVNKEYKFELQIKSKILSAWGDMEHTIFYKDYSISPVRENTQASMNHIGRLLFQIDDFLESIRIANKKYEQSANVQNFLQWFDKIYSETIKKKYKNIGFKIDEISELLYAIFIYAKVNEKQITCLLRFDHLEYETNNEDLNKYIVFRNKSNKLKILESIVLNWQLDNKQELTKENITVNLNGFINLVISAIADSITKSNDGYDYNEIFELVKTFYANCILYGCDIKFICDISYFGEFLKLTNDINDLLESEIEKPVQESLRKIIFVALFEGELINAIDDECKILGVDRQEIKGKILLFNEKINPNKKFLVDDLSQCINNIITIL